MEGHMRKWRKMTWALWAWSALILVWMFAGGGSAAQECANQRGDTFLSAEDAQAACEAGAGIGILLVAFVGFVGFLFLALIWFMTKPKGRDCPVCGDFVKRGAVVCGGCGHDFRQVAQRVVPTTAAPPQAA